MQRSATGFALSPFALMLFLGAAQAAQQAIVIPEDNHGLTIPMRLMSYEPTAGNIIRSHPQIPNAHPVVSLSAEDPALQTTAFPMVSTTPGLNVLGLGNGFPGFSVTVAPPDTNAAVGATQVVETVNLSFAVFNKSTGAVIAGPTSIGQLWANVDSSCSNSNNLSDPVVLYDQQAGRWVIEIITVSSPYKFCMAVSSTSDATGTYHSYAFTDSAGLPDYTKMGVWSDAYYLAGRQFNASLTVFLGPIACAADRSSMIAGTTATLQCIQINNAGIDGMLPADLDGSTAPPAGSPEYFLLIPLPDSGSATTLQLYKFTYVKPSGSTLSGPVTITVKKYTEAGSFNGFVPQSGTTQKLDGTGFTLMHRLAYRNFTAAPAHESLVVNHSVKVGSTTSTVRYAPRWYEIRSPGTTPVVFQQGTFSPDTTWRWTGSIGMDKVGNIALGYSASSSSIHPQLRYTGRVPTDSLGTMEAEATIFSGSGSQTGRLYRWGDYSSMAIDPSDDCTFWYANEYIPSNGSFNWATHLFSFKFTSCQ